MNGEMRAHVFFVHSNQKSDREKSGTRGHDHENKNGLAPQILFAGPLAQPVLRRHKDRDPNQNEKDESEYVPDRDDAGGKANMAVESNRSSGRDHKSNRKTVAGVHSASELERMRQHSTAVN